MIPVSNNSLNHCKKCDRNLCKFCIIGHYKNTAFTKDHDMGPIQKMLMKSTIVCQGDTAFIVKKNLTTPC